MNQLRILLTLLSAWFCCWQPMHAVGEDLDPKDRESKAASSIQFNESIRPIFTKHCTACHGGVKQAGDVSFVTPTAILPPDGWVVEPGDPDASALIERVESDDPEIRMPPPEHGKALSTAEIKLLREWIRQGAQWRGHWAYEKPLSPAVPDVQDDDWAKQTVDRFVLARLEQEGIAPSNDASPERWLRRVTLDLAGLPPSLKDREAFLQDLESRGEPAYQAVVDRLLQSPAYGERWASVWLDQVRYADSRGLGLDARRNVWKYRDWVIDSLNHDMPFTDFTIKQIAGDLLPEPTINDLVATAAHRLTQTNQEGGTDDEEFRIAAVLDRVNTTWQTWQGVTFGCVQCHSHPYDPFQHEEYYRFAAFFNNTRDTDLDDDWPLLQAPLDADDEPLAAELDREILALKHAVWEREFALLGEHTVWRPIKNMSASTDNDTKVEVVTSNGDQPSQIYSEYRTVGTVSRDTAIILNINLQDNAANEDSVKEDSVKADLPEADAITAIRFTGLPLDETKARSDSEWGFVLSHVRAEWIIPDAKPEPISIARVLIDEPDPYYDPQESLNEKSSRGFAAFSRIHFARSAAFVLAEPTQVPKNAKLRLTLKNKVVALGAFPIVAKRGHIAVSTDERFTDLLTDASIKSDREKLTSLKKKRKSIESTSVPIMRERPAEFARPSHVFIRGLFLTKGEEVTAGTPASMPAIPEDELAESGQPAKPVDRLAMARWLVSSDNPLTARVAVNRVWARLFGVGIVGTEEDFGTSGERPTHPNLLDYLALRFQNELGYRFKPLVRELVLSRTYRQSSIVRAELEERDGQNRLLWRGPRHRLSAEVVRDQALACAGLLSDRVGGPPVHPPIPDGVWRPFVGDKWATPEEGDADRYRRSVYTYTKRSIPYPMFASFDSPSREFCAPRRLRSNTPLQALMTMNDLTFVECANGLAKRMLAASDSLREQVRHGFMIATSREPTEAEINDLVTLKDAFDSEEQLPAMAAIANVLLNLDEVLTK